VKLSSAQGRNLLRERQRRDRATAQPLRVSYPQFASLKLQFEFREVDPDIVAPVPHLLFMHPPSNAYFLFPCPHADCDGEFDLTTAVAELARSRKASCDGRQVCGGQRVRNKSGRGPCELSLKYTIAPGAAAEE
jgi:hypothetical protein